MSEKGVNRKNTAVAITPDMNESLGKVCKRLGLSKKEFVEHSILYFTTPGKDPRQYNEEALAVKVGEIAEVLKRFESRWISSKNTWEKEYLKPMLANDLDVISELKNSTQSADLTAVLLATFTYFARAGKVEEMVKTFPVISAIVQAGSTEFDAKRINEFLWAYYKLLPLG